MVCFVLFPMLTVVLFVVESCDCHQFHHSEKRWLITDFGFATFIGSDSFVLSHRRRGTDTYRPPELVKGDPDLYGHPSPGEVCRKSDIWAIGCILFRIACMNKASAFEDDLDALTGRVPALDIKEPTMWHQLTRPLDAQRSLVFCQQTKEVFAVCFARDPNERETAFQLKERFERMRDAQLGNE
jgi:serine/threonine protein kinase